MDGPHDADIAGAATKVAAHSHADVVLVRRLRAQDEIAAGHQHAGRAIAALQSMFAGKCRTQLRADVIVVEALDRGNARASAGYGIGDARTHRNAVDQHGAGAAHAMFAAEVGAGEVLRLTNEIGKMRAGLDLRIDRSAVDGEQNRGHDPLARAIARRRAAR